MDDVTFVLEGELKDGAHIIATVRPSESNTYQVDFVVSRSTVASNVAEGVINRLPNKLRKNKAARRLEDAVQPHGHEEIVSTSAKFKTDARRWVDQQLKKAKLPAIKGNPSWEKSP